jgi:hypothetical protein
MAITVECPRCHQRLKMRDEFIGLEVQCPGCGTVWAPPTPPGGAPAAPSQGTYTQAAATAEEKPTRSAPPRRADSPAPRPAGPQEPCPACGSAMASDAVLCIECGFNLKTGKRLRTVKQRFERCWDGSGFPLWGRLVAFGVLFAVCLVPLLFDSLELAALLFLVWGVVFVPLLGIFKRVIITRNRAGKPVLVLRWFVFFIPCPPTVVYLGEGYERIRTGARVGAGVSLSVVLLFLLCGIPGLIYAIIRANQTVVTLEVAGSHTGEQVEPILVYRGTNEATMRQIGDTLKSIGGLYYG